MVDCERGQADDGLEIARGAFHGLLFAMPLWFAFAVVTVFVLQDGPTSERSSLVLMIAAVAATILMRPYLRALWTRHYPTIRSMFLAQFRQPRPSLSLARQTFALSALTGAYLQFYFLEVNLQIASMRSVTVFVPVSSMT